MKTKLTILLICVVYLNSYTQISFQEHLITADVTSPTHVITPDIDGDGFFDVLYNSLNDEIAWHKNTASSFGAQLIIASVDNPSAIHTADIDGDGDLDVIAAYYPDVVAWYKNTDGIGTFGAEQIIATEAYFRTTVKAADIDADGDLDIISAGNDIISWNRNQDGLGNEFSTQIFIYNETGYGGFKEIHMVDIDNDGDLDILSAGTQIAWFKNDSTGNFGAKLIISTSVSSGESVYASDIDGDGDLDVVSASYGDNKIAWYQNDGLGNFGTQQIIATDAIHARAVYTADMDGDGDQDIIAASESTHHIVWYDNTDGLGTFSYDHIISTNASQPHSVIATDVDNDGDMDVLAALAYDSKIYWYENLGSIVVDENQLTNLSIYPNPTTGILYINYQTPISKIEIYNQLGQLLIENTLSNEIDISNLNNNLYLVKIIAKNGNFEVRKIIKK